MLKSCSYEVEFSKDQSATLYLQKMYLINSNLMTEKSSQSENRLFLARV